MSCVTLKLAIRYVKTQTAHPQSHQSLHSHHKLFWSLSLLNSSLSSCCFCAGDGLGGWGLQLLSPYCPTLLPRSVPFYFYLFPSYIQLPCITIFPVHSFPGSHLHLPNSLPTYFVPVSINTLFDVILAPAHWGVIPCLTASHYCRTWVCLLSCATNLEAMFQQGINVLDLDVRPPPHCVLKLAPGANPGKLPHWKNTLPFSFSLSVINCKIYFIYFKLILMNGDHAEIIK